MLTLLGKGQTWICTYIHLAVKELIKLDEKNRDCYRSCLYNNGVTALKSMDGIEKYDNYPNGFDIDWHPLNDLWEDYHNDPDNGTRIADREFAYWHKEFVPHRFMEHHTLGDALFSSWVAVSCGDERISKRAFEKLKGSVSGVDWDNLHLSYAFVVECAFCAAQ